MSRKKKAKKATKSTRVVRKTVAKKKAAKNHAQDQ